MTVATDDVVAVVVAEYFEHVAVAAVVVDVVKIVAVTVVVDDDEMEEVRDVAVDYVETAMVVVYVLGYLHDLNQLQDVRNWTELIERQAAGDAGTAAGCWSWKEAGCECPEARTEEGLRGKCR